MECDFFENKYTVPRRFKYKVSSRVKGEIEKRLDLIMEKLGIEFPDEN
ncbi:protein of unknown function [Ruminococcaceae bacterium BL-6]|nr:protein of unknown function [Ruminococcaceae bacterium BL-6]CAB1248028.1 protein of unknown function [Ruminococcaceae bacterium BL-6]